MQEELTGIREQLVVLQNRESRVDIEEMRRRIGMLVDSLQTKQQQEIQSLRTQLQARHVPQNDCLVKPRPLIHLKQSCSP